MVRGWLSRIFAIESPLVGAGLGLYFKMISKLLGYTLPRTAARYTHLATTPVQEAAKRIGQKISITDCSLARRQAEVMPLPPLRRSVDYFESRLEIMATANQLRALLKSYGKKDDQQFYAVAMQLAAHEARLGHGKLARELRSLIDDAQVARPAARRYGPSPVPLAAPRGELAGLLSASYPDARLQDMILPEELLRRLRRVLREQRQQSKLLSHGLPPRSKLLLVGPPGSGKTMTARALAGELKLPLFTILLDGVITKFMGETAAKLRLVFDAIRETRGVYLFDEFDAIGGQRGLTNDVGEIRRVLNSFLHFLEEADPTSLIVAATNHPDLLDPALFRRFDDVVEYALPDNKLARRTFQNRLQILKTQGVDWSAVVEASQGLSYAEIVKSCEDALKEAILENTDAVDTRSLLQALSDRKATKGRPV
jgi:SpoVK/Ycf46/Vps4 family AAA+-type ATPase